MRKASPKTLLCKECNSADLPKTRTWTVLYGGIQVKIIDVFRQLGYEKKRYRRFLQVLKDNDYDVGRTTKYFEGR